MSIQGGKERSGSGIQRYGLHFRKQDALEFAVLPISYRLNLENRAKRWGFRAEVIAGEGDKMEIPAQTLCPPRMGKIAEWSTVMEDAKLAVEVKKGEFGMVVRPNSSGRYIGIFWDHFKRPSTVKKPNNISEFERRASSSNLPHSRRAMG